MSILTADIWKSLLNVFETDPGTLGTVVRYFRHYGTLGGSVVDWMQNLAKAIADLKAVAGQAATPTIDKDLLDLMNRPRCGCLDVQRIGVEEARWRKTSLTYFISAYVNGISQADQDDIIKTGFRQWSDYTPLTITRVMSQVGADIVIATGSGQAQGFDGPSGTLAYAYLPNGSDQQLLMRFDIAERWMASGQGGILMLNVACHEFGHLLGLEHSRQNSALMAPFYAVGITKPQQVDDIPRIQALYGASVPPVIPPPPPPTGRRTITLEIAGDVVSGSIPGYNLVKQ